MNFVFKMMIFVFKMMDLAEDPTDKLYTKWKKTGTICLHQPCAQHHRCDFNRRILISYQRILIC